ncbi:hypothetical protein IC620_16210 [Hazenella sp. IB182357]|uniref:Uncharacterized protein n=1 Tax=Polycladospora coralii TaxID=2771432 RepID=A0A926RVS0_9BACL|nr:hypothetical protein [Polycladospora coralii]MBD1373889.1 hypothetical protein [Polycladospora coralii]
MTRSRRSLSNQGRQPKLEEDPFEILQTENTTQKEEPSEVERVIASETKKEAQPQEDAALTNEVKDSTPTQDTKTSNKKNIEALDSYDLTSWKSVKETHKAFNINIPTELYNDIVKLEKKLAKKKRGFKQEIGIIALTKEVERLKKALNIK